MEEKVNAQEKRGRKWYWLLVLLPVLLILAGAAVWAAGTFFGLSRLPVPNNVSAENVGLHELRISWDSSPKIQQYQVILSTEEFTREKLIENGWQDGPYDVSIVENAAEITIHSLLPDTDYYIAVAACREGKEKITCSDPSETVKIHTSSLEVGRVADLTAEEVTDRQIKLKWTDWTTSEKNQDHTDIDITYTLLCTALPTENSTEADRTIIQEALREPAYIITDAAPFTRYAYTVVANALIDGKAVSGESSEVLEVLTKPEAVAGLDARADGTSSLAVTWKPYELNPGTEAVVTYSLYGSDQEDAEFTLLEENMTDTAYTETGLTGNQTRYYYVVAHILLEGEKYAGMACQPVSATTNPPVTAPPSPPAPPHPPETVHRPAAPLKANTLRPERSHSKSLPVSPGTAISKKYPRPPAPLLDTVQTPPIPPMVQTMRRPMASLSRGNIPAREQRARWVWYWSAWVIPGSTPMKINGRING
ncbi:MAG: hypothetical protein HFJ80_05570 [Clostridiales bacterium]|nr:hypothetical protein [Clostridiales bacterium]